MDYFGASVSSVLQLCHDCGDLNLKKHWDSYFYKMLLYCVCFIYKVNNWQVSGFGRVMSTSEQHDVLSFSGRR